MADGTFSAVTVLDASSDSVMDLDNIDELLLECWWFETADGSEFLPRTSISSSLFEPYSFGWSVPEINGNTSSIPPPNNDQNHRNGRGSVSTMNQNTIDDSRCLTDKCLIVNGELQKRWSLSPRSFPGPSSLIERLIKAVKYIKEFVRDEDVLVQVWVPVNTEGRMVLTTNDLPFSVNGGCSKLAKYRDISMRYQFSAEKDSKDVVGLPSRVFIRKVPEWTPDVTFFRSDEYPRVTFAQQCDVRGTLALPVFEQGNKSCLAVIEVVRTSRQIKYVQELESVCKALEAVDLRSSDALGAPNSKLSDRFSYGEVEFFVLADIHSVLRFACETHRLPLAQTWAPCLQQGREGCRHSDENYVCCVSTVDRACFVADPKVGPFHEACSEYHLLKGQGVVGEAFTTHKPCFSSDVRLYGNTKYPLSHHARMFNLSAAVAIRLRSLHASKAADFVLEFFLPVTCTDPEEQRNMQSSLLIIIQHSIRSLRLVTDKELEEEGRAPFAIQEIPQVQQCVNDFAVVGEDSRRKYVGENSFRLKRNKQDSSLKEAVDGNECFNFGEGSSLAVGGGKNGEKKRTKADKAITFQVLRQYFAGSLKDAAKSIGVCPTTLKRICRQHGIKRWPSRKIKKVGHSLQKLQRVIDSVEGASGTFQIGSLYSNFPEIASPTLSRKSMFLASKMSDCPKTSTVQREGSIANLQGAASKSASSSCSQGSSSSLCCSSRSLQFPPSRHDAGNEDPNAGENSGNGELKRVKSEAELHVPSQEGMYFPRSQNQRTLSEHLGHENSLRGAKDSGGTSEEDDSLRVKVTYGDEKIRLKMYKNQGFRDLLDEIGRRFQISDTSKFDLKYLDDDSEWVLLTCDADLEECIDVYKQSESPYQTIKLSLQLSRVRNSLGSNDLSHCKRSYPFSPFMQFV